MKALSLWQPWASLVALGEKRVETREWTTKYRGELAIHATAKIPPRWLGASRESEIFRTEFADVFSVRELIFGNYAEGRYAWFFEMVERFETPIPAKGSRMLWEWAR